eukprot:GEMP01011528.1.p1 GENE.GEMP01011528.1~~GEMP01011528.1.p1  ORF type:complete len:489 (+),score=63.30 GEMP01011528.1:379-1845(+)
MRSMKRSHSGHKDPERRGRRDPIRRDGSSRSRLRSEGSLNIDFSRAPSFYGGKGAKERVEYIRRKKNNQDRGKGGGKDNKGSWKGWPPVEPRLTEGEEKGLWGLTAYHDWLKNELRRVQNMMKARGKPMIGRSKHMAPSKGEKPAVLNDKGWFYSRLNKAGEKNPRRQRKNDILSSRPLSAGRSRQAEGAFWDEPPRRAYSFYPEISDPYKAGLKRKSRVKDRQGRMHRVHSTRPSRYEEESSLSSQDTWLRSRKASKTSFTWDKPSRIGQALSDGTIRSFASPTSRAYTGGKEGISYVYNDGKPGSLLGGTRWSKGSPSGKGNKTGSTWDETPQIETAPMDDSRRSFSSRSSRAYKGVVVWNPTSGKRRSSSDASQQRGQPSFEGEKGKYGGQWARKRSSGQKSSSLGDSSQHEWPPSSPSMASGARKGRRQSRKRKHNGEIGETRSSASSELAGDEPSQDEVPPDTSATPPTDALQDSSVHKVYVF